MAKFDVDEMHVVEARAVGADVHRMHLTASLRLCEPGRPAALSLTSTFATHPQGLRKMVGWLGEHEVGAATMEGAGICWEQPYRTLEAQGEVPADSWTVEGAAAAQTEEVRLPRGAALTLRRARQLARTALRRRGRSERHGSGLPSS